MAGERTDGTVLWMADERAIAEHVVPKISKAAAAAGRAAPRVIAGIPVGVCLPEQVDDARERANRILGHAEFSPNYQRLLEQGDATDVGDIAAVGSEADVERRLRSFADAGATDLSVRVLPVGKGREQLIESKLRTQEFLSTLAPEFT
jgi:5,10-methylenetetrahydromethanopterin reductase